MNLVVRRRHLPPTQPQQLISALPASSAFGEIQNFPVNSAGPNELPKFGLHASGPQQFKTASAVSGKTVTVGEEGSLSG